ncbi:MAG: MarR family transcriptional regulator [Gammaproteobacteria bacterium]|nr:MAG: MarR family transcriptional regulator [Gammaproteobacteria bacterium]
MSPAISVDTFPSAAVTTVLRELCATYQVVLSFDSGALKRFDVSPSQADVILSLGCEPGQSCRELSESTLLTRGSLSSTLDRLEARGLVSRSLSRIDRRKTLIRLTSAGEALFERLLPERATHIADRLSLLDAGAQRTIVDSLRALQRVFE